jgi:hypothetical protein
MRYGEMTPECRYGRLAVGFASHTAVRWVSGLLAFLAVALGGM